MQTQHFQMQMHLNPTYYLSISAKEPIIYMQFVPVLPYNVNKGVSTQNRTHCFDLSSRASNFISLKATYLKFAILYVDILVQIVYLKFKNGREKDNGYTGCMK